MRWGTATITLASILASSTIANTQNAPIPKEDLRKKIYEIYGTRILGQKKFIEDNPSFFYVVAALEHHKKFTKLPKSIKITPKKELYTKETKRFYFGEWNPGTDEIKLSEIIFQQSYTKRDGLRQYNYPESTLSTINHELGHKITDDLEAKKSNLLKPIIRLSKNDKGQPLYNIVSKKGVDLDAPTLLALGFATEYGTKNKYEDLAEFVSIANTSPQRIAAIPLSHKKAWKKINFAESHKHFPHEFKEIIQIYQQYYASNTPEELEKVDKLAQSFLKDHKDGLFAQHTWLLRADIVQRTQVQLPQFCTIQFPKNPFLQYQTRKINFFEAKREQAILEQGLRATYKDPIIYEKIMQRLVENRTTSYDIVGMSHYSFLLTQYQKRKITNPILAATTGIDDLLKNY